MSRKKKESLVEQLGWTTLAVLVLVVCGTCGWFLFGTELIRTGVLHATPTCSGTCYVLAGAVSAIVGIILLIGLFTAGVGFSVLLTERPYILGYFLLASAVLILLGVIYCLATGQVTLG